MHVIKHIGNFLWQKKSKVLQGDYHELWFLFVLQVSCVP